MDHELGVGAHLTLQYDPTRTFASGVPAVQIFKSAVFDTFFQKRYVFEPDALNEMCWHIWIAHGPRS